MSTESIKEHLSPFRDNHTKRPAQSQQIRQLVINNRIQEAWSTLISIFHLRKWVPTIKRKLSEYAVDNLNNIIVREHC